MVLLKPMALVFDFVLTELIHLLKGKSLASLSLAHEIIFFIGVYFFPQLDMNLQKPIYTFMKKYNEV